MNDKVYHLYSEEEWNSLSSNAWVHLLQYYPQYSIMCNDWTILTESQWIKLLLHQPQLAEYCDWSKFNKRDWVWLAKHQPELRTFIEQHMDKFLMLREMRNG